MLSTVASKHFLRFFLPGIFLYMYRFPIMQRHPLRWFRSSVCPNHNNPQTKPDCRPYRQSRVGCRFGSSGSSGFVVSFRRLRWSSCGTVPGVVAVRIGIEIGISAVQLDFLQEVAAVPNESGFLFEAV